MNQHCINIENKSCVPHALTYVRFVQEERIEVTYEDMRKYFRQRRNQYGFTDQQVKRYILNNLKHIFRSFRHEKGIWKRDPALLFDQLDDIQNRSPAKTMFLVYCWAKNQDKEHPDAPLSEFKHLWVINFRDNEMYCSMNGIKRRINKRLAVKDLRLIGDIYSFH